MKLGGTKALSPLEFLVHKKVGRGSAHSRRGEEEKVFQLRRLLLPNPEKEKKKGTSSLVWQRHLFLFSLTIETTVLSEIITCCCTWPACQRFPPPGRALSKSKSGRGRQIPSATWQIKKGNSAQNMMQKTIPCRKAPPPSTVSPRRSKPAALHRR